MDGFDAFGGDEFGPDPYMGGLPGVAGGELGRRQAEARRAGPPMPIQPIGAWPPRSPEEAAEAHAFALQRAIGDPHVSRLLAQSVARALHSEFLHTMLPPWIHKPFRGDYVGGVIQMSVPADNTWYPFNAAGAGGSTSTDWGACFSQTVPAGHDFALKFFGNDTRDTAAGVNDQFDAWDNLQWRIALGGQAISGFRDFRFQFAQIEDAREWLSLVFTEGQTWSIDVRNTGGSPYVGVARMVGWTYPTRLRGDSAQERRSVS